MKKYVIKCRNCGIVHDSARTSLHIFCSNKCQHEYQYRRHIEKWLSGEENPINTNGLVRPWVRKYFFQKYDNKCSLCGWGDINKFTGLIPLEIDHIDGNHSNNSLINLRLICPNCHSLTNNYKILNRGRGRKNRK